jgi:HEAT repeat protein
MVAVLSDLTREDARTVAGRWDAIPDATRLELVGLAVSLANDHIDLDFTRLGLIGLSDPSSDIRELSAGAVGENGGAEVAERLAVALEEEDDEDVAAATATAAAPYVLDFELGRLDRPTGERLVEALRKRLQSGTPSPHARAPLLEAVAPVSAPWIGEVIRDAYYGDDRDLRLAAVSAMGQTADDEWLDFLDEQMQSDDPEFRRRAAEAAGIIASEDAVEMLAPLLDDEDIEVVTAALFAFAEIGGPDAVAYLEEFEDRVPEGLEDVLSDAAESARTGIVVMRPPGGA